MDKNKVWSGSVFNFRVLMNDDSLINVTNSVGDVVRWERNRDERWMSKGPGVEGLLYLAWLAGRRHGPVITEKMFDTWAENVVDFEAEPVRRSETGESSDLDPVRGVAIADPIQQAQQVV